MARRICVSIQAPAQVPYPLGVKRSCFWPVQHMAVLGPCPLDVLHATCDVAHAMLLVHKGAIAAPLHPGMGTKACIQHRLVCASLGRLHRASAAEKRMPEYAASKFQGRIPWADWCELDQVWS